MPKVDLKNVGLIYTTCHVSIDEPVKMWSTFSSPSAGIYRVFQKKRYSKLQIRWKNNKQRKLDAVSAIDNTAPEGNINNIPFGY